MAKLTSTLLVLALIATPLLNAMEVAAARRSIPGGPGGSGGENDTSPGDKLYGGSKFFWWGLPPWGLGLLHPWLFGPGPFWWLKDVKTTNPNNNPEAFAYDNGHGSTSEVANFAPTSHSP